MESRELAKQICEALADKKGEDIKILNISEVTVLADYFIIASRLKQKSGPGYGR